MPLMLEVANPAALAWATSVRIDEAMGSLVKVMSDHAAASSLAAERLAGQGGQGGVGVGLGLGRRGVDEGGRRPAGP